MERHEKRSGNLILYYGWYEQLGEYFYQIDDTARPSHNQTVIQRRTASGLTNIELAETLKRFGALKDHIAAVIMNQPI